MFRTIKLESDSLVDRDSHSFRRGIAIVPCVDRDRLKLHAFINLPKTDRCDYFPAVAAFEAGTDARLSEKKALASARVTRRAANPAPKANRITGPKLLAAASPTK